MKIALSIFLTILNFACFGQDVKQMNPELGILINKSVQGEVEYIKLKDDCEKFWGKYNYNFDESNLTEEEKKLNKRCVDEVEATVNYWAVEGPGCSWYCAATIDSYSASSFLKAVKNTNYSAANIHDLDYRTAWIEGVPSNGVGEYVIYHFPPQHPRITEVIVVNGYIKSLKSWKDNSRVKKLKMYINDEPVAILNLADSRQEQHFKFAPIGNGDRKDYEILCTKKWWTMKFEIMEVYQGDKYDDTAITEIYFDGIDDH